MYESNMLNEFEKTTENNFRYHETRAELDYMKKEYSALTEAYIKLEKENSSNYSQIQSLRLAFDYHSSYQVNKEADYKLRIKELEKSLDNIRNDRAETTTKYIGELHIKETYIEHLLTTMLNLHQKIEYYRDDLSVIRTEYEKQHKTLISETMMREQTEEMYWKSLKDIEDFKQSLTTMKQEYTETKKISENLESSLKNDYEHEHNAEISALVKDYQSKIKLLTDSYNHKLHTQEKSHSELMKSINTYMNSRIDSIKSHYEDRISKMIREYSFQEAKFQSRISDLSLLYNNLQQTSKEIEEDLMGKTSCLQLLIDQRKQLLREKKELDKYLEKASLEHKATVASTDMELETMRERFTEDQAELKKGYETKVKLISQRKIYSVEEIRLKYERKLEKTLKNSEEGTVKLAKFNESQCKILLDEMAKLETEKTELTIKLDCELKELQSDAEYVKHT